MKAFVTLILLATSLSTVSRAQQGWQLDGWSRPTNQPVITPDAASTFHDPVTDSEVHWEKLHTFNPAAVVRDGKIYVLYRAEDDSGQMKIGAHVSRLGLATSVDGVHFMRQPAPVFFPDKDTQASREQPGGVEDPRLVQAPDGSYVLTYTQWSRTRHAYSVGIATSSDLLHWQKHGPAFGDDGKYANFKYKSAGILTRQDGNRIVAAKLNGHFWMYWGEVQIRLASSDDLIHWTPVEDAAGEPLILLQRRPGHSDSQFPEVGPPPLLTERGILLLYNAKNSSGEITDHALAPGAYSVQEALFSATDPTKLLTRTEQPVFKPEMPFERSGQYAAGTTFAEGLVWFKDTWWLYYGCADSFVGVATTSSSW